MSNYHSSSSPPYIQFPWSPDQVNGLVHGRLSPKLWRVRVTDGVLMGTVFDTIIVTPILSSLGDRERSKVREEVVCRL